MTITNDPSTYPPLEPFLKRSTCYAGIGSRAAPRSALILIGKIAKTLADYGLILRSGGAPGADTAFERGCDRGDGKKEIFLPWKGFNKHPSPLFDPPERAAVIAAFIHPNWRACKPSARQLHARNCQQVYGLNLDSPVQFVLFWAPEEDGKVKGGTATAVNLAREMKIPTFNLWDEATREQWMELVDLNGRRRRFFWKSIFQWLERREER